MPRLVNLTKIQSRRKRPASLDPWDPGVSARHIMKLLLDYRYLTSELLCMVYEAGHGRGCSHVRHELTKLWRHGYVERFYRPADVGSSQYVYAVSVQGARLLIPDTEWSLARRRIYNVARAKADYEHALALSLLKVIWDLGSPSQKDIFTTVSYWQDKEGTKDAVVNQFSARVGTHTVYIRPDATVLIGHLGSDFYRPYFFEVERTHKNYERIWKRLSAYVWLMTDPNGRREIDRVFAAQTNIAPDTAFAVFIGADKQHAERLRDTAARVVDEKGLRRKDRPQIWFSSLEAFFCEGPVCDGQGRVRHRPDGAEMRREYVINPVDFFRRELFVNLDGRPGRLVI